MSWNPGDHITLRYTGHYDGDIRDKPGLLQAFPHIVVQDSDDLLVLWMPKGTLRSYADLANRSRSVPPVVWHRDTLRLMIPGKPYGILTAPRDRGFTGWYVNLEAPFVRTAIGVDTSDNSLDVLVAPDLSWRWKDEDTMQYWMDAGVFTRQDVDRFYEEGRDSIAGVEAKRFPFDGSFLDWEVHRVGVVQLRKPGGTRYPGTTGVTRSSVEYSTSIIPGGERPRRSRLDSAAVQDRARPARWLA